MSGPRFLAHRDARKGHKVGDKVKVHGHECEVVDDKEAETADFVVCVPAAPWLKYPDNITGPCADCGVQLQWRPHAPKKPPKLCMRCMSARLMLL